MTRVWDHAEWFLAIRARFGADPRDWAFRCPACGDIASGREMLRALAVNPFTRHDGSPGVLSHVLALECIGAVDGGASGRGCSSDAYSASPPGDVVRCHDGALRRVFPIAAA